MKYLGHGLAIVGIWLGAGIAVWSGNVTGDAIWGAAATATFFVAFLL